MQEALEILQKNINDIRCPTDKSLVYKDECVYSFHCQVWMMTFI